MILRIRDVLRQTGLSEATVYRLVRRGAFPAPVRPSPGTSGWLEDEVAAWIRERAAARPPGAGQHAAAGAG